MMARVKVVVCGLLLFLQLNCGGTSGDTFSSSGTSAGGTSPARATNGPEVNTSKGVFIEGGVDVPTPSKASITIGTDIGQEVTISKGVVSDTPTNEGEVCCKRYDGVTVANGSVDASGEIVDTVVPPALLDTTGQIICEVELKDGGALLSHYDLTNKVEGDRVRVDVSEASTAAAEQVLSECGSAATFKNMEACADQLKREDFEPRKLFEKYRDKIESDSHSKVVEPLNPVISEEDAKKFFELILQTPYGLDKTRDASEQGNLGRPLMGKPYGQDKEVDIDKNKNQEKERRGRPFRYEPPPEPPPPEPTPEPAPEPTPEPPPPVILEAPINTALHFSVMSSGWNLAITPETLGGGRYQSFAKSVSWSYLSDPNIAGFRVYDKVPGESAFRLLQAVDLSQSSAGVILSSSGNLVNVWLPWSGGIRMATEWPLGVYESYIVAYDVQGQEGPASEIAYASNLGEIQWLRPTEGQVLGSYYPTFQWSNVWPLEIQTSGWSYPNNWGWTEMTISEEGAIYNLFHGNVGWFTTSWRELLQSGHQYYSVVQTGGFATINGVKHSYFGYSRLVGFSAQ